MSTTDSVNIKPAERTVLEAMDAGTPYLTSEIADRADTNLSQRTIFRYLTNLEERGIIDSRKPNQTTTLWIRND